MKNLQILLIDDEVSLLEQAKIFLEKIDKELHVDTVNSAVKAVDMLEEGDYDAVVSDYQMPEMDGLELLKELRIRRGKDIPFIVFTGKGRENVAMKALNLGADRYIQKGGDPRSQYTVVVDAIKQEVSSYKNEQILKKRTQQLEAIFQDPQIFMGFLDLQGNLIKVNKSALRFIGKKAEDVEGKKFWNTRWWDHSEELQEKLRSSINTAANGESVRFETIHFNDDSKKINIDFFLRPVLNEEGEIESLLAEGLDITEKLEKQEIIKTSNEIMNSLSDPVFVHDLDGNFLYVNDTAVKRLGYSLEELLSIGPEYIDSKTNIPLVRERIKKIKRNGRLVFESEHVTKDGKKIPVEINSKYIYYMGNPAILSVARDISRRKIAETRFEKLFNSIPQPVYYINEGGIIEKVNDATSEILGYSKNEIIGNSIVELPFLPDKIKDMIVKKFQRALEGVDEGGKEVFKFVSKGSDEFYFKIRTSVVGRDGSGKGVLGLVNDVTDILEKEKEYYQLINSINDAIFLHRFNGEILMVNDIAEERYSFTKDELKKMNIVDIKLDKNGEFENKIEELKEEGRVMFETVDVSKDGGEIPVEINASMIQYKGEDVILGVSRKISHRN